MVFGRAEAVILCIITKLVYLLIHIKHLYYKCPQLSSLLWLKFKIKICNAVFPRFKVNYIRINRIRIIILYPITAVRLSLSFKPQCIYDNGKLFIIFCVKLRIGKVYVDTHHVVRTVRAFISTFGSILKLQL